MRGSRWVSSVYQPTLRGEIKVVEGSKEFEKIGIDNVTRGATEYPVGTGKQSHPEERELPETALFYHE